MRIGRQIHATLFPYLSSHGVKRMVWTYEPLEGRNANLYLNRSGGRVYRYLPDFYPEIDRMNSGMPVDRFLVSSAIDSPRTALALSGDLPVITPEQALLRYPVVKPDYFPMEPAVLVRIPGDLQEYKRNNQGRAIKCRMETRLIFEEYINRLGYISCALVTGRVSGGRVNYYLLVKGQGEDKPDECPCNGIYATGPAKNS
jgi:chorismate synthase